MGEAMNFGRKAHLGLCMALVLGSAGCGNRAEVRVSFEARAGDVTDASVAADAAAGNEWLLNGRTADAKHFSPLTQITDKNASRLGLAWYMEIRGQMGVVAEPIEVGGILYISAPLSIVYAVDAATGKVVWKYDPQIKLNQAINGSYSARVNGGVAVWNGKVYVGTGDCRLIAIDAAAGTKVWEATVCEPTQTGITQPPHIVFGRGGPARVLIGYNGSDDGVRGSIVAYDADSGKEAWRFWTVPGDPARPFETKALEMAAKTWQGQDSWKIGGGDVWNAITYDDATGLVIFGTAGAGVDYGEFESIKTSGPRLFSGCILAVKADTGEYVWHFQTSSPGMQTENNHIVMADLTINGEKKHVAMTAPKNGFFYVLEAATGKLLAANPLVKTTWATGYDVAAGHALEVSASAGGGRQWTVHNWWPMSYSPLTGLVYVPTTDRQAGAKAAVESGESGNGLMGRLIAWDPVAQSAKWTIEEKIAVNGGVLATAGNLVFQPQGTGEFAAYAADSGQKVWSVQTGSASEGVPVSYSLHGEQYVVTAAGWGSGSRLFAPARTMATAESKRGPVRVLAFKLRGTVPFPTPQIVVPPVPEPPKLTADAATVRKGEQLYRKFVCDGCHSPGLDGSGAWVLEGAVPDLRYAPADVHRDWYAIVLGGSHWDQGMPGFADPPKFAFPHAKMTAADADALHAYVIDGAWKAYRGEQAAAHVKKENY